MLENALKTRPATEPARGDRVITPADEVAFVQEIDGEELQLVYADALNRDHAEFALRSTHCAVWLPDQPRPKPIRRR